MAEIDSLGTNYYYSGVQNASNEAIKRNTKKEESSNVEEIMKLYGFEDEIDIYKTQDDIPYEKAKTGKRICEDEEDFVGNIIQNGENIPHANENEQANDNNVNSSMNKYLNDLFDEMNNNCFCFEPLLIPIKPIDNNYNISYSDSSDPISKFMDDL